MLTQRRAHGERKEHRVIERPVVRIDVLVQRVIGDLLAAVGGHLGEDVLLHVQIVGRRVLGQQLCTRANRSM